jgi:hypothetical protein
MTSSGDLRRLLLRALLIAALVSGAAALIALARGEFTDTDIKAIATSLLFGLASTMAVAGIAARGNRAARDRPTRPRGVRPVAGAGFCARAVGRAEQLDHRCDGWLY